MQDAWVQTSDEFKAYNLELQPIQLGHLFMLRSFESPYLPDSGLEVTTQYDGRLFAYILATPYEKSMQRMSSPYLGVWMKLYKWRTKKANIDEQNSVIASFVLDQFQQLRMAYASDTDPNGWDSETPTEYSLLCSAMTDLGMSLKDAMHSPIRILSNLIAVKASRSDGKTSILTHNQIAHLDNIKELIKKRREESVLN